MHGIGIDGADATEYLSIKRNKALEQLYWFGNRIPSDQHADLLIRSIIDNRSINTVRLRHCFGQEGANGSRALTTLMASGRPFHMLDFDFNGLFRIHDVATALATNPKITILSLSGNVLNDGDAELIAQALEQNTNLQKFYIDGNNFTFAGFDKIRATIYDTSSLKSMESCNHTC